MIQNEEFLPDFIQETTAHLETVELLLVNDKNICNDLESIHEIFRAVHSIKGTAGLFGLSKIIELSHAMENIFGEIRKENMLLDEFIISTMLRAIDKLKEMVSDIYKSEEIYIQPLVSEINEIFESKRNEQPRNEEALFDICNEFGENIYFEEEVTRQINYEICRGQKIYEINLKLNGDLLNYQGGPVKLLKKVLAVSIILDSFLDHSLINSFDDIIKADNGEVDLNFNMIVATSLEKKAFSDVADILEDRLCELNQKVDFCLVLEEDGCEGIEKNAKTIEKEKCLANTSNINQISVNIQKLDHLMELVGELVISETMVTGNPDIIRLGNENFMKASRHHRKIISEINEMVMSVRMVPLYGTFQKMNRIIHDMSQKLKKEVMLEIIGEDTEVDKNIIENISDPLVHLVRNSIDHGIETRDDRIHKGKSVSGKITLEAKNSGSNVVITVRDDGKGLDQAKIYQRALENGLTSKDKSELSEKEIFSFIFMPGFSTKEEVSEFSGRGVGMDVVVKNIKKIGGSVEVESEINSGTSIHIKIPLTLAIVDGMLIAVGKSTFIIPTINIKESFRPKENEVFEDTEGNEMIFIREECYPIIRLHNQFNIETRKEDMSQGIILMVEHESSIVCLFADDLIGEQQVVVKALPKYIKKINGISGCTLLGDGNISLIIDLGSLLMSDCKI